MHCIDSTTSVLPSQRPRPAVLVHDFPTDAEGKSARRRRSVARRLPLPEDAEVLIRLAEESDVPAVAHQ